MDYARIDKTIERFPDIESMWRSVLKTCLISHGLIEASHSVEFSTVDVLDENILEGMSTSEIGIAYEYCLTHYDPQRRKETGTYYTPEDVADLIASLTKGFPEDAIWCDPCVGSGSLSLALARTQDNPHDFIRNNLRCMDIDPVALLITRTLFAISYPEDSSLFLDIKDNFKEGDFLDDHEIDYDHVIMNPPYVSVYVDERFRSAQSKDIYAFFLEKSVENSLGVISITPQSFTHTSRFASLREVLLEKSTRMDILCFDNMPDSIFKGVKFGSTNTNRSNSVRAAITVIHVGEDNPVVRTTSLLRWRSHERQDALDYCLSELAETPVNTNKFPKVSQGYSELYQESLQYGTIGDIANNSGEFMIYVPATPRYYISALSYKPQRSSLRVLHFDNKEDWERSMIVLNSSLTYWWWRVVDGGMMLSLSTLMSTPVPDFNVVPDLIEYILTSEKENVVYSKNAGSFQENVKHPPELVKRITSLVVPGYSERLSRIHDNSFLANNDHYREEKSGLMLPRDSAIV